MTLRQATIKAKKELQIEAVTVICRHKKSEELTTYDITLAHRIAEMLGVECKEVVQGKGKKVKYLIKK